jgi:hypothetical protein
MIELENYSVRVAAVDARMHTEVGQDLSAVLNAPRVHLRDRPPDVIRLVGEIVCTAVCRMAGAAVRIEEPASRVRERELTGGLVLAARAARIEEPVR